MSNKIYTTIPAPKLPRNTFNRSRPNSLTMPFQRNVPTMAEEIYPGDMMRCNPELFARLQPMIAPVMNNMKISTHFFFVPLRTLNKHFAEFMFNNRTGDYNEVLPYCYTGTFYCLVSQLEDDGEYAVAAEVIRLLDFIGLPFKYASKNSAASFVQSWLTDEWNANVAGGSIDDAVLPTYNSGSRINLAPFLAYQKIWSEYFRDENVEEDPFVDFEDDVSQDVFDWTGDKSSTLNTLITGGYAVNVASLFQLRRRAWAHDRFTSSLPFAQRGPDVLLPVSGSAPVVYRENALQAQQDGMKVVLTNTQQQPYEDLSTPLQVVPSSNTNQNWSLLNANGLRITQGKVAIDPNGLLEADLDTASLTTSINDFRIAERVQRWYENDARGGVRPNEGTLAHFGIRTPDSTLDRAEFIGGSMQPIVVSEVAQTSESTASSPQGTLAGKGTSYKSNRGFRMFFTEHGFVFGLCSALVRANYWQGIPKMFSRMQRDEYYWPEFANLGEEPVFTKEIYADATAVSEEDVFGYVPRYSDLKSAVGEVHGDMRSSLSFWTQTREFSNKPELNRQFLFGDPSLSPFAVQSLYSDPIILTVQFHLKASRLMPFYGVPTL